MADKHSGSADFSYLGDKAAEKGKDKTPGTGPAWRGPPHKERQEEERETKRALKKQALQKADKVSWRKRLGGVVAILFLCGVGLYNFIATIAGFVAGSGISTLDVQDTAGLKRVLFDGEPWLVYCVNNETQNHRLPAVLEDSARSVQSSLGLHVGVLGCWERTASGRSVAERFKLPRKPPLSFVVANGNKPRIVQLTGVSKAEDLEKLVKPALEINTYRIEKLKQWSSLCTSRRACVVVGYRQAAQRDAALSILRPLLESHRAVKVVTLDTSFWQLKLEDAVLATRPSLEGKDSSRRSSPDVLCLARRDSAKATGNATFSGAFLQQLDAKGADVFLKACEQQSGLVQLSASPRIRARPSKPKQVTPSPRPAASQPAPSPSKPRDASRANVDRVGSRAQLERDSDLLFEAVDDEADEASEDTTGPDADGADDEGDEVEL